MRIRLHWAFLLASQSFWSIGQLCGEELAPSPAKFPFQSEEATQYQASWASFLKQEVEIENSIGMTFRLIPPGEFTAGSPKAEAGHRFPNEQQQPGRIEFPFYLGVHEVTQEQYQEVLGENPSSHEGENYPVEQLTWNEAERFCRLLSEREGVIYRLPHAMEWEYACRAGTSTPFSFGESMETSESNFDPTYVIPGFQGLGEPRGETVEVGSFPANAFGIHDMHGNVAEWCQSIDPWTPGPTDSRLHAGGGFSMSVLQCRSAAAQGIGRGRHLAIGFRIVREVKIPADGIDKDFGVDCAARLMQRIEAGLPAREISRGPRFVILPAVYPGSRKNSDSNSGIIGMGSMWISQSATLLAGYQPVRRLNVSLDGSMSLYTKLKFYEQSTKVSEALLSRCVKSLGADIYVIPRISGGGAEDYKLTVEIHGNQKEFPDKSSSFTIPLREPELFPRHLAATVCEYFSIPFEPRKAQITEGETSGLLTKFEGHYDRSLWQNRLKYRLEALPDNATTVDPDDSLRKDALVHPEFSLTWYTYLNFSYNRERTLKDYQEHAQKIDNPWIDLQAVALLRQEGEYRKAFELLLKLLPTHVGDTGFHQEFSLLAIALDEPDLLDYLTDWWSREGRTPYDRKMLADLVINQVKEGRSAGGSSPTAEKNRAQLQRAKGLLEEAIEASPSDPMFRADIVRLASLLELEPEFVLSQLTTAVAADPSYPDIYHKAYEYLQPRWQEAPESALQFGVLCARSGLWEDKVPELFYSCLRDLYLNPTTMEMDYAPFRENPLVWEGLKATLDSAIDSNIPAIKNLRIEGVPHKWNQMVLSRGLFWGTKCKQFKDLAIPLKVFEKSAIFGDPSIISSEADLDHLRDLIHSETAPGIRGKVAALRVALARGDSESASGLLNEIDGMHPAESLKEVVRCRKGLEQLKRLKNEGHLEVTPQMILESWKLNELGAWRVDEKTNELVVRFPTNENTWMLCPFGFEDAKISGKLKMLSGSQVVELIMHAASDMDSMKVRFRRDTHQIGFLRNDTWLWQDVWNESCADYSVSTQGEFDTYEDKSDFRRKAKHSRLSVGSIAFSIYPGKMSKESSPQEREVRFGPMTFRIRPE